MVGGKPPSLEIVRSDRAICLFGKFGSEDHKRTVVAGRKIERLMLVALPHDDEAVGAL